MNENDSSAKDTSGTPDFHCPNCCGHKPPAPKWDKIKDNLNKVLIPLCLPLVLLLFTCRQNQLAETKKKDDARAAQKKQEAEKEIARKNNQLETEIKVLAILWPDLTSRDPKDSVKVKNALDVSNSFLKKIYTDNIDSLSPLLTSVSVMAGNLLNSKYSSVKLAAGNFSLTNNPNKSSEQITPSILSSFEKSNSYQSKDWKPVIEQKQSVMQNLKNTSLKSLPTVFLQYSSKENKNAVEQLIKQLSDHFLVPPADHVENKVGYGNEIRYYHAGDSSLARNVQKKLFESTGKSFQLKNIRYNNSYSNTLEVWYNNEPEMIQQTTVPEKSGEFTKVANYQDIWFKPKYVLNFKEYDLSLLLVSLEPAGKKANVVASSFGKGFEDVTINLSSEKTEYEFIAGKYKYMIKLKDVARAGKNFLIPNAAYLDVIILKKK